MKYLIFFLLFFAIVIGGITFLVAHKEETNPFSIAEPADSPLRFIKNAGQWKQDFDYLIVLDRDARNLKYGTYAVALQTNDCIDTSACFAVSNVSIYQEEWGEDISYLSQSYFRNLPN